MDGKRFDKLVKAFAPLSRRLLVRAAPTGLLLIPALRPSGARSAPVCVEDQQPCEIPGPPCCSGTCRNGTCLLSPGKPCAKRSQCASNRCAEVGKRKRRECLCCDARRACNGVCCTSTQTCQVSPLSGKTCVEEGVG